MNGEKHLTEDIRAVIRDYLLDEGILRKKLENESVKFGFQFVFPPGPPGKENVKKSQSLVVFQPKNKHELLIISIGTQISPPHIEALQSNESKILFFKELKKFLHLQNLFFYLDIENSRYEISDQVFIENNTISKNDFFLLVRKVFNIQAYSNLILLDFCSEEISGAPYDESSQYKSGSGFSLYS
jgi:hypothetical protein